MNRSHCEESHHLGAEHLRLSSCPAAMLLKVVLQVSISGLTFCTRIGLVCTGGSGPSSAAAASSKSFKMIMEMPRSFTNHPLSRKVEQLKIHMKMFYLFKKTILKLCYWQVQALSEDGSLRDSKVQLM